MHSKLFVALLSSSLLSACTGQASTLPGPHAPASDSAVVAEGSLVLSKGMSVAIAPATTLTFERIVSDSRCPKGVQCVWAGEVTLALRLKSPRGSDTLQLANSASEGSAQGYRLKLLSYQACPGGPAVTPLTGECATLQVSPAVTP